jgi:hypothetical protein
VVLVPYSAFTVVLVVLVVLVLRLPVAEVQGGTWPGMTAVVRGLEDEVAGGDRVR